MFDDMFTDDGTLSRAGKAIIESSAWAYCLKHGEVPN